MSSRASVTRAMAETTTGGAGRCAARIATACWIAGASAADAPPNLTSSVRPRGAIRRPRSRPRRASRKLSTATPAARHAEPSTPRPPDPGRRAPRRRAWTPTRRASRRTRPRRWPPWSRRRTRGRAPVGRGTWRTSSSPAAKARGRRGKARARGPRFWPRPPRSVQHGVGQDSTRAFGGERKVGHDKHELERRVHDERRRDESTTAGASAAAPPRNRRSDVVRVPFKVGAERQEGVVGQREVARARRGPGHDRRGRRPRPRLTGMSDSASIATPGGSRPPRRPPRQGDLGRPGPAQAGLRRRRAPPLDPHGRREPRRVPHGRAHPTVHRDAQAVKARPGVRRPGQDSRTVMVALMSRPEAKRPGVTPGAQGVDAALIEGDPETGGKQGPCHVGPPVWAAFCGAPDGPGLTHPGRRW